MLEAAIQNKVKKVICLSTDKAVYPINAMEFPKNMEKVIISNQENLIALNMHNKVWKCNGFKRSSYHYLQNK